MRLDTNKIPKHHGHGGQVMDRLVPGCFGKTGFTRLSIAEREIKRMLRRRERRGERKSFEDERLSAYRCHCCGHWHIGNGVVRSGQRKGEHGHPGSVATARNGREARGHQKATTRRFHWRDCLDGDEEIEAPGWAR